MGTEFVHAEYNACIRSVETIYDGDTIDKVEFRLPGVMPEAGAVFEEIYPDLFLREDGLWCIVNVRLAGIDTPERHPRHHYPNGVERPAAEIARERRQAMEARDEVVRLLSQSNLQFHLRDCQLGKYAGRIVGEVWVETLRGKKQQLVNVSEHLIARGLGEPYQGGKKRIWGVLQPILVDNLK